jgi:hypothetical protein
MTEPEKPRFTHHVKVREKGKKRWAFLSSANGTNQLRVHALQFTEEGARKLIADNQADNPDWEFKAQPI